MALSKPRPILQDMPPHIKEKIFSKLDYFVNKMSLQKAFPEFRRVIRNPEFPLKTVELTCFDKPNRTRLEAEGYREEFMMEYTPSKNGTILFCTHEDGPEYKRLISRSQGNHIELLVETFESLVENPKFELEKLMIETGVRLTNTEGIIEMGPGFLGNLGNMLKNLKRRIKVRKFTMNCFGKQDNVLKILPYIDPDHLKHLRLYLKDRLIDGVDKLMKLEQWKKIEHLSMFDLPDNKFPIEQWWNFPKITMEVRYTSLEDIQRLVQHFRRSKTFVSCCLITDFRQVQLKDALGKTRVLVPHPIRGYGSYMELPATKTLKRLFVHFPYSFGYKVVISTELEREEASDEDF